MKPELNINQRHLQLAALTLMLLHLPSSAKAVSVDALLNLAPTPINPLYLMIGGGLLLAMLSGLIFTGIKYRNASRGMNLLTSELGTTRDRLADALNGNDTLQKTLEKTNNRNQETLNEANIGLFKMDTQGTCTYINSALQDMSGLYPKKALKEGLQKAIHDDDLEAFQTAWDTFTNSPSESFNMHFRFKRAKGRSVYVQCRANRILNEKKDDDFYMGWVTDVTRFQESEDRITAETKRYERFVTETHEAYFQLTPDTPINLNAPREEIAEAILKRMKLTGCNNTFSAMYGFSAAELNGQSLNELQNGCGPLRNRAGINEFIDADFHCQNMESIQHDPNGNRLNLMNNMVGLIENGHLVGIWGAQQNISQQKREKADLTSQVQFLKRIMNSLPGDVYVKDTRCRYLYASSKMAERTGIPQEEWIGKTTAEVLPGTSKGHDKPAIEVMKTRKMGRRERAYESKAHSGWMETIQVPLVSAEDLVEGVIGLSIETSERRSREEKLLKHSQKLEQTLKQRTTDLENERSEHRSTSENLNETTHKLSIIEDETARTQKELLGQIKAGQHTEEVLRQNKDQLLKRQKELEGQIKKQINKLEEQSGKLKTWDDLLAIKEQALKDIEANATELQKQLHIEMGLRKQVEEKLKTSRSTEHSARTDLDQLRSIRETERDELIERHKQELNRLKQDHEERFEALVEEHRTTFRTEHEQRKGAERNLKRTNQNLKQTQEQMKQAAEQQREELEREVAARKASAGKLVKSMDELHELKQQFSVRIEDETRIIKQELAKKQIREKTMRQHEKELQSRIQELEKNLQVKHSEYTTQLQAREEAELLQQQASQQLEQLKKRQAQLVERETQKLNLNVAEIRLDEIKLRKQAGDLQRKNELLEDTLASRTNELKSTTEKFNTLTTDLKKAKLQLDRLQETQDQMVQAETEALNKRMVELRQVEAGLRQQDQKNKTQISKLGTTIEELKEQLIKESERREKVEQALAELNEQLETDQAESQAHAEELAHELQIQNTHHQKAQEALNQEISELHQIKAQLEEQLECSATEYNRTQEQLKEAELFMVNLKNEYQNDATDKQHQFNAQLALAEQEMDALKSDQQNALEKQHQKTEAVIELVDGLGKAVNHIIEPLVTETENSTTPAEQSMLLKRLPSECHKVVDLLNYSSELSRLKGLDATLQNEPCNLHELITQLDEEFSGEAEAKKLFFAVSFSQHQSANSLPELIETDSEKLKRSLSILLNYAIAQTQQGRLGLHAACKPSENGTARIIFDLAYTAEQKDERLELAFNSESTEIPETKYGLSVVQHYTQQLNGSVHHEWREGGLSVLSVEIPFRKIGSSSNLTTESDERTAGAA